jgi:circadian clock protein KaiB
MSDPLRSPDHPQPPDDKMVLRLYVAGSTPRSSRAITNLKIICETNFKDSYALTVMDIYARNAHVIEDRITVAPMLIRKFPLPECRLFGDLSQTGLVLAALDLPQPLHERSS